MNKNDGYLIGGVLVFSASVLLILWLINQELEKSKRLAAQRDRYINELEKNNFELIKELLNTEKKLPDNVKLQIIKLIEKYKIRNLKIAIELESINKLIEAEQYEKAILSITKIIENILKQKFENNLEFISHLKNVNGKKRRAVFSEFIDYAKKINILSKAESQFALGLKELRNEEAHELAVKREVNFNLGSILTAIDLVIKCDTYLLN